VCSLAHDPDKQPSLQALFQLHEGFGACHGLMAITHEAQQGGGDCFCQHFHKSIANIIEAPGKQIHCLVL
jgi:hypothetical protein